MSEFIKSSYSLLREAVAAKVASLRARAARTDSATFTGRADLLLANELDAILAQHPQQGRRLVEATPEADVNDRMSIMVRWPDGETLEYWLVPPSPQSVGAPVPEYLRWMLDNLRPSSCGVVSLNQEQWQLVREVFAAAPTPSSARVGSVEWHRRMAEAEIAADCDITAGTEPTSTTKEV